MVDAGTAGQSRKNSHEEHCTQVILYTCGHNYGYTSRQDRWARVMFIVIERHKHCTISCLLFCHPSFPLTAYTISPTTPSCSPFLEQTAHLYFSVFLLFLFVAGNVLPFPSGHLLARLLCIFQVPITDSPSSLQPANLV